MTRRLAPFAIVCGLGLLGLGAMLCPAAAQGQSPGSLRPAIAARYPDVRWVDTGTLARWMQRPEAARPVLLDARAREEHDTSHLRGARLIDPEDPDIDGLDLPRNRLIVVYCSVAWRSGNVADRLQQAGYRRVYNLHGGLFQWANEGRPIYRQGARASKVHPYDRIWGRMLESRYRAPL